MAIVALPISAVAQNLGMLTGQTRLQRQLGLAISEPGTGICPRMIALGYVRDDGSDGGDLFGRCGELVQTANRINGGGPQPFDLDIGAEEVNQALDSIAHTQMPAIGRSASEVSLVQTAVVTDRMYALHQGDAGIQIAGHAYDEDGKRIDFDFLDAMGAAGDGDAIGGSGLGLFVNVKGGFGDRDGNAEERGFDYENYGATVGVDYRFSDQFFAGLAGGYTYSDRDFDRDGGNIDGDTYSGYLFAGFQENGFYVDALYGFAYHEIDSDRNVFIPVGAGAGAGVLGANRSAKGDTDAIEHQAAANVGYVFDFGALGIGPVGRIEYVRLDVDGFDEKGAGGLVLSYRDDDIDSLITNLGAEVSYQLSTGFGVITPQVGASWAHQFEDDSREITAQYKFDPTNTKFFVKTKSPDRDYIDLSASIAVTLSGGFSAFVAYDTILAHSDLSAHLFTLGGRVEF